MWVLARNYEKMLYSTVVTKCLQDWSSSAHRAVRDVIENRAKSRKGGGGRGREKREADADIKTCIMYMSAQLAQIFPKIP